MINQCNGVCKSGLYCRQYAKRGFDKCHQHLVTCPVCYDPIKSNDDAVKMSSCSHTFCTSCIQQWVNTAATTCPMCRTPIPNSQLLHITGTSLLNKYFNVVLPALSPTSQIQQFGNILNDLLREFSVTHRDELVDQVLQGNHQSIQQLVSIITQIMQLYCTETLI